MIIECIILYLLFTQRLTYKFNPKYRLLSVLLPLCVMVIRFHLSLAGLFNSSSANAWGTIIVSLSIFSTAVFFFHDSITAKFLWFVIFLLILSLSDLLTIFIFSFAGFNPDAIIQSDTLFFISSLISKAIAFLIIGIMGHLKKHNLMFPRFARTEIVSIIIINLFFLVFSIQVFQSSEVMIDKNIILNVLFLLCFIISILTLIIVFKLSKKAEEDLNKKLSIQQLEMENKLNLDMTNVVDTLRSLRHDMNNHIMVLKNLIHTNQYEILQEYIDDICNDISPANDFIFLKNKALSALLYNKSINSKLKKIDLEIITSIDYINIPEKDLCSLMGNLLDNAIEACEKVSDDRYIKLSIYTKDDYYHIECSNSFIEAPIIANNTFISTKKNKALHGIGFKNMKAIVNKYSGTLEYTYYDLFKVNITLACNSNNETKEL